MQISYNWLKQFLKLDWEAKKTAELLTDLGLEVEGISTFESVKNFGFPFGVRDEEDKDNIYDVL